MNEQTQIILDELNAQFSATDLVKNLSIAQQQMVEICRAISTQSRIIVMDEPTASLTDSEIETLFKQIEKLKTQGIAIIYISHRMDEIKRIADRITVLRDGNFVGTLVREEFDREKLIKMMVGRTLQEFFDRDPNRKISKEKVLEVRGLTNKRLKNISFYLRKGEILGFAGLLGVGRTELARAIFGVDSYDSGSVILKGRTLGKDSPRQIISSGIALVPEDRKKSGLFLSQTVSFNMTIPVLEQFMRLFSVDHKKERRIIDEYINSLSIKMSGPGQVVRELSGGNQQKIVISKWLASRPEILILDEPTRGIDVGAKSEIYHLMSKIAAAGVSIILISSEMPEIINLSDRILVMHEGRITGELYPDEFSQEKIMHHASGGM